VVDRQESAVAIVGRDGRTGILTVTADSGTHGHHLQTRDGTSDVDDPLGDAGRAHADTLPSPTRTT
jgi:hypothetical protein